MLASRRMRELEEIATARFLRWLAGLALLVLSACVSNARVADLETLGVRIQDRGAGWYELRAPEGYSFRMPGVPLVERERFSYAGKPVPQRFFDLTTEAGSRGFLVHVFDARELGSGAFVTHPRAQLHRHAHLRLSRVRDRARRDVRIHQRVGRDGVRLARGRDRADHRSRRLGELGLPGDVLRRDGR